MLLQNNNLRNCYERITVVAAVILFALSGYSQANLVPNGSFELYSSCPTTAFGQIDKAVPWFQPNYPYAGAGGSSDYDHFCTGYDCNSFKQCPRTGSGMAGIALFTFPHLYDKDHWREYIEVALTDSLKPGKKYCVRLYASMLDNSCFPVRQIQAVFTNDSLTYTGMNYEYIPGLEPFLQSVSVISDSINWVLIETVYTAAGGERFLTIGNFAKGDSVEYDSICSVITGSSYPGYYYFDDISVYEQPDVFAGNDTIIPPGDSLQLGVTGRPDILYSWSPAAGLSDPAIADPVATPGVSTTYTLTVTDTNALACTAVFYDTVTVLVGYIGVAESNTEGLVNIYPNPNTGRFAIQFGKMKGSVGLEILTIAGSRVFTASLETMAEYVELDLPLCPGLYLLGIETENGRTYKRMIVHQ